MKYLLTRYGSKHRNAILLVIFLLSTKLFVMSLTFINEESSYVRLRDYAWKANDSLHFKLISNFDTGVIFTATNEEDVKLVFKISVGVFELNIGQLYNKTIDLRDDGFDIDTWIDIHIYRLGMNVVFSVGGRVIILPRSDWLIQRWKDIELGGQKYIRSSLIKSFIGCIEFPDQNGANRTSEYILHRRYVLNGCVDACMFLSCKNGGACINNYKNIRCDCRHTGYEGPLCEKRATTILFNGFSSMEFLENTDFRNKTCNEHSIRFNTLTPHGILLSKKYTDESLVTELYEGSLYVMRLFNGGMLRVKLGNNLNDNSWHHLLLFECVDSMVITLDRELTAGTTNNQYKYNIFNVSSRLTIGGVRNNDILASSNSKSNFKGCLQAINVNERIIFNSAVAANFSKRVPGTLQQCE